MAIDTRQKRMSAINVGSPWRGPMVVPTGSDTQAKRQAAAFMYSGIASGAPVIYIPYEECTWIASARSTTWVSNERPTTNVPRSRPTTNVPGER